LNNHHLWNRDNKTMQVTFGRFVEASEEDIEEARRKNEERK
jgi:hypothetical protein